MTAEEAIVPSGSYILLRDRDGRRHAVRRGLILGFSETEEGDVALHLARGSLVLTVTLDHALDVLALCS